MKVSDVKKVTGYKPFDYMIHVAEQRGLQVEVKDDDRNFVIVRISNSGIAGENHLNDENVSMYVSFRRSQRGRFAGGFRNPMLGKMSNYSFRTVSKSLRRLAYHVERMYIVPEMRTQYDHDRDAREAREYEAIKAQIERRSQ